MMNTAELDPLVTACLLRASTDHPRLFLERDGWGAMVAGIDSDPLLGGLRDAILVEAEKMLSAPSVARELEGNGVPGPYFDGSRMLGVSRDCLRYVVHLAFAFRVTRDRRFFEKARTQMLAAASFADWHPAHFLDVAEMATALAIGYDWLFHELSAKDRQTIREAVVTKGLRASFDHDWPVSRKNNWSQVCHAGLVLGALACHEDERQLATDVVSRAIGSMSEVMDEIYDPSGAYAEGPMYWSYGTTFNVMLIDALRSVLGNTFDLENCHGLWNSADYLLHATGPTGLYFNYSDGRDFSGFEPAMCWLAARKDNPCWLWGETAKLRSLLDDPADEVSKRRLRNRLLPLMLVWYPRGQVAAPPVTKHWKGGGANPIGLHRSSWHSDAIWVGVKAGSPACPHGHMDVGSFVVDAMGVRWALDLGMDDYQRAESTGLRVFDNAQSGDRWRVYRNNNLSHSVLVVDGEPQRVNASAPIVSFCDTNQLAPHTTVDMSDVYAGQLKSAIRSVSLLDDRAVLIQDNVQAASGSVSVRWGMVTGASIDIAGQHATLRLDGKAMRVEILQPQGIPFQQYDTANAREPHDSPNPGTSMLGFDVAVAGAGKSLHVAVLLTPLTDLGPEPDRIDQLVRAHLDAAARSDSDMAAPLHELKGDASR